MSGHSEGFSTSRSIRSVCGFQRRPRSCLGSRRYQWRGRWRERDSSRSFYRKPNQLFIQPRGRFRASTPAVSDSRYVTDGTFHRPLSITHILFLQLKKKHPPPPSSPFLPPPHTNLVQVHSQPSPFSSARCRSSSLACTPYPVLTPLSL